MSNTDSYVNFQCYLILTISLELVFWLVPKFVVSAVAVAFQGFFIGPLFPTAITAVTKLLPTHLHVVVIGFVAALGGCGASVLPFAVGALAQRFGVMVLQPVIIGLLGLSLVIWLSLPKIPAESTSQGTGGTLVPPLVKVIAPLSC